MRTNKTLESLLKQVPTDKQPSFVYDRDALQLAFTQNRESHHLTTKVLSVFGGLLTSLFFLGFIFISGIYESALATFILGILLLGGSLWFSKFSIKPYLDTLCVCAFIVGLSLINVSMFERELSTNVHLSILLLTSLLSLAFARNYILSFLSLVAVNGTILAFTLENDLTYGIYIHLVVLALMLYFISSNEARIITKHPILSKLYSPIRTSLLFCFLIGLIFIRLQSEHMENFYYKWATSWIFIGLILVQIPFLFNLLGIEQTGKKWIIYGLTTVLLLTTSIYPPITGALFILLLSFRFKHTSGMVISIISFVYFISQFYYDLYFNLLHKSLLLMGSGVLFLVIFIYINKKWMRYEK